MKTIKEIKLPFAAKRWSWLKTTLKLRANSSAKWLYKAVLASINPDEKIVMCSNKENVYCMVITTTPSGLDNNPLYMTSVPIAFRDESYGLQTSLNHMYGLIKRNRCDAIFHDIQKERDYIDRNKKESKFWPNVGWDVIYDYWSYSPIPANRGQESISIELKTHLIIKTKGRAAIRAFSRKMVLIYPYDPHTHVLDSVLSAFKKQDVQDRVKSCISSIHDDVVASKVSPAYNPFDTELKPIA